MIHIHMPCIEEVDTKCILKARIDISEDTSRKWMQMPRHYPLTHWRFYENYPPKEWETDGCLYFEVDKQYGSYLCSEKADAFVVAMLYYAMCTGSDIISEAPVSAKLLFGVNELLIPLLKENIPNGRIKVIAQPSGDFLQTDSVAVGTGMSCGVDSLYTLQRYSSEETIPEYKLTHLCYFDMGAIFHPNTAENKQYKLDEFYDLTAGIAKEKLQNAKSVADAVDMPMVFVYSNLDKDFYRGGYGYTGVYRNCAMVLALQKLFAKYYCSSAGWPSFYDPSLKEGSEHYEIVLCSTLSTENTQFIISDTATRMEKTIALSEYPLAFKYLDVCFNFNNCGVCAKCYRTLLTLEILGTADNFAEVFDVNAFRERIDQAWLWLLKTANNKKANEDSAVFAREILRLAVDKAIEIPRWAKIEYKKYCVKQTIRCIKNKTKRTVKRIIGKV